MTPARIANSIQLDRSFLGTYLLLEGKKDIKLFKKLFCEKNTQLKPTFGKHKMREVYTILSERGFNRKVGIRDADYLRLDGNEKYVDSYEHNIFITDYHDSEGMVINSQALNDFIHIISDSEKVKNFERNYGNIKELIYRLCYPLACLRLVNKVDNLGLSFKPANPEGNKLKYRKFISESNFSYLGHEKLINTVVEYSTNRGSVIAKREVIIESLEASIIKNHPVEEVVNGHDLAEILYLVGKKGLNSTSKTLQDASCIEESLCLAYNINYFSSTDLFNKLKEWQITNNMVLIK